MCLVFVGKMTKTHPALVIVLTGVTGTGKTTLQRSLKRSLKIPSVLLGRLLERNAAREKSKIGAHINRLIAERGVKGVVGSLVPDILKIATGKPAVMIEELHRPEDLEVLQETFPKATFFLVEVTASPQTRQQRIMRRESLTESEARQLMAKYDSMQKWLGYERLVSLADLKILNDGLPLKDFHTLVVKKMSEKSISAKLALEKLRKRKGGRK